MSPPRTRWRVAGLLALVGCGPFSPASEPPTTEVPSSGPLAAASSARRLALEEGGRLRLFDSATGELVAESDELQGEGVRGIALSADGQRIVVSTYGARLLGFERRGHRLDLATRVTATDAAFRTAPVFGAEGALAIARADAVDLWRDGDLRRPPISVEVGDGVQALAFRPADGLLAVAFTDRVEMWDIQEGTRREVVRGMPGRHVAFAPNGALASGGRALARRAPGEPPQTLEGASGCDGIAWAPGGEQLGCVAEKQAWVCTGDSCQEVALEAGQPPFRVVVASPEGLLFGGGDGRLIEIDHQGRRRVLLIDGLFDRPGPPR